MFWPRPRMRSVVACFRKTSNTCVAQGWLHVAVGVTGRALCAYSFCAHLATLGARGADILVSAGDPRLSGVARQGELLLHPDHISTVLRLYDRRDARAVLIHVAFCMQCEMPNGRAPLRTPDPAVMKSALFVRARAQHGRAAAANAPRERARKASCR